MHRITNKAMKSVLLMNNSMNSILKSQKGLNSLSEKIGNDVGLTGFSSMMIERSSFDTRITKPAKRVAMESIRGNKVMFGDNMMAKGILNADAGGQILFRGRNVRESRFGLLTPHQFNKYCGGYSMRACFVRSLASNSTSESSGQNQQQQHRKDITTVEDPFDAPTYNIPEKPVTFVEGASYSVVILAGLGVALGAAYFACKELLFEPREYKVFGQALERVKNESQVRVRIGSPIKGYGVETRNRHARQQIPHRVWTDEDGVEHVEINFVVRGPHGTGNVYTEMFKDKVDKKWKYTYLIVDIKSPSQVQLMLESYIPA